MSQRPRESQSPASMFPCLHGAVRDRVGGTAMKPDEAMPRGSVIGHRGAAGLAPENTAPALLAASRAGAAWVEVDVRHSLDGVAIVFHDDRLSRCTDGFGAPELMRWSGLARLDAGAWFHPRFRGTRILRLDQLLEQAMSLGLGVNLELKPGPHTDRERLVDLAASAVTAQGVPNWRLLLSSFDDRMLAAWRTRRPGDPVAVLCNRPDAAALRAAAHLETNRLNVSVSALNPGAVAALDRRGYRITAWTCNRPPAIRSLWKAGLHAVISDRPDRFSGC